MECDYTSECARYMSSWMCPYTPRSALPTNLKDGT